MISALLAWLIAYCEGGRFYDLFRLGLCAGAVAWTVKWLWILRPRRVKVKRQRVRRSSAPSVPSAVPARERKPSLVERWKAESESMVSSVGHMTADNIEINLKDEEEEDMEFTADEKKLVEEYFGKEIYYDKEPEPKVDEDEEFSKKELLRLEKVLSGLYLKRDKMRFVYGIDDPSLSQSAREAAKAKMERTKAWRGLQFDIDYVLRNIEYLERAN